MLGFLLRLLPFWVREPLLIVVGSVLGVRIMYLAVHDHDRVAAGLGTVFLVFTAIRVHVVIRALRARRNPSPAVSGDSGGDAGGGANLVAGAVAAQPQAPAPAPAQAQAQAQAQVGILPRPSPAAPEKEPNAWGQAAAALALFGALALALWAGPRFMPSEDNTPRPPSCSDESHEELPKVYQDTPRPVTGEELCKVLNRADLAELLGTPGETATTVSGTNNTAPLTDEKVAQPEASVTFDTYTVNVSATYNELTIDQYVKLMKFGEETDVKRLTVLGRPAVLSSAHTMRFEIDLGSSGSGGPVEEGPLARSVSVALDRGDRGGYCDISVWSTSGTLPNDSVLLELVEKVLPGIPERPAR
ncbi:DUF6215 domain-containing protein [Streptomyces sp. LRE541]|uniref:DUF6215 domain-containing protein n=1 Tax=Streptomyces sp. LRE541 TaxID=2931983 RepID=UPI00200D5F00|nr:DUF6215 domain-containing protein [Streptomyces sp. LRE541]UPZ30304.1 DUF6215 domain-containing protein [Streptomyces sp. LRE541]